MTLAPSLSLPVFSVVHVNFGAPSHVNAGSVFLVKRDPKAQPLYLQTKMGTGITADQNLFGVGLNDSETLHLGRSTWVNVFLGHLKVKIERQASQNQKTSLDRAYQLRIPASQWNELQQEQDDKKRMDRKNLLLAFARPEPEMVEHCFDLSLKTRVVSKFGSPRALPSGRSYRHSGVDLRGLTGAPVKAAASGVVVLADHMTVPGNNVIVAHGGGIYSRYMHLDKMLVKTGERVKRGQTLGEVGSTGRVEASHLHWEMIWKGSHVDPHHFLQVLEPICDQG